MCERSGHLVHRSLWACVGYGVANVHATGGESKPSAPDWAVKPSQKLQAPARSKMSVFVVL